MRASIALYKGPPDGGLTQWLGYWGVRIWTWSRWSHAELVLDGICYSSSARDGGVRAKVIDLASGHWDVFPIDLFDIEILYAKRWFELHDDAEYDWINVVRFVLPFIGQSRRRYICFEAVGAALGLAAAHKLTANDLRDWARRRFNKIEYQLGGL